MSETQSTRVFYQCPACGKHFDDKPQSHGEECPNGYDGEMISRRAVVAEPTKAKRAKKSV